ncbi:RagB/SusD family nutrient uptake outer membrane protein [Parabacteroides sp. PF5-6]|uniref:RagB/SusD family nutrient uptake outer membrane protein n=1 Tax=Parabacteroides sp. PF5-6 TaxID=1742403 RepID=UPI00240590CA|nr:RagB/SusD family nutrient uptake outer membrane protein [Parabacteroides sp. PF5-6]MDF9830371.1 hypothetical protein [Parabacteroides sp. PF5-6]
MKKNLIYLLSILLSGQLIGCDSFLDRTPTDFLTDEQVWNDNSMILGVLANLYDNVPMNGSLQDDVNFSLIDDVMWCGLMNTDVETARNQMVAYAYDFLRYYDYGYIYKINQSIEKLAKSTLSEDNIVVFESEFRFLRAYVYFELARRMGGVPIVTETQSYTSGMDITQLQVARSSEAEVYDFVYSECMAIKEYLAANNGITNVSRANKYAALALASRAMLYAGSISKYNASMANPISSPLQSGVVGMSGTSPNGYYEKALSAAEEIINDGVFQLHATASSDDFYHAVCSKDNNREVIWSKDYSSGKFHTFSFANIAWSMNEDNDNGSDLCPTLGLVESYLPLNGGSGRLADKDANGNYIAYENISDIFAGRDYRLQGTCLLPGQTFKGAKLDVLAGVAIYQSNGSYLLIEGSEANSSYVPAEDHPNADGGPFVGKDGPLSRATYTNTGFNLRKFVDEAAGSSARGQGSYIWWVYFRMGEVYLNAAEAAMELGQTEKALRYANAIRERAGFGANSWSEADLTIDNLLRERRCELVIEDHRFWDMKRLRKAHQQWNGIQSENTMLYALYPFRVIGGPDNGKYIFDRHVAYRFRAPRNFRIGNYYSSFSTDALNKNPKLVQNPNF